MNFLTEQLVMSHIKVAMSVSESSLDPRRRVGAVIAHDKHVVATGFNQIPEQIETTSYARLGKSMKNRLTLHAELVAIFNASHTIKGCNMYIYGLPPCPHCVICCIHLGIENIYFMLSRTINPTQRQEYLLSSKLCLDAGINLEEVLCYSVN